MYIGSDEPLKPTWLYPPSQCVLTHLLKSSHHTSPRKIW